MYQSKGERKRCKYPGGHTILSACAPGDRASAGQSREDRTTGRTRPHPGTCRYQHLSPSNWEQIQKLCKDTEDEIWLMRLFTQQHTSFSNACGKVGAGPPDAATCLPCRHVSQPVTDQGTHRNHNGKPWNFYLSFFQSWASVCFIDDIFYFWLASLVQHDVDGVHQCDLLGNGGTRKVSVMRNGSGLADGKDLLLSLSRGRKLGLLVFPNKCVAVLAASAAAQTRVCTDLLQELRAAQQVPQAKQVVLKSSPEGCRNFSHWHTWRATSGE